VGASVVIEFDIEHLVGALHLLALYHGFQCLAGGVPELLGSELVAAVEPVGLEAINAEKANGQQAENKAQAMFHAAE
jgi:hypothetical protein